MSTATYRVYKNKATGEKYYIGMIFFKGYMRELKRKFRKAWEAKSYASVVDHRLSEMEG